MVKSGFVKTALVMAVAMACMFGLAACQNSGNKGAAAATVNGTEISEKEVTDQIQTIREQSGLSEESEWGTFLAQNSMTPATVREQIINSLADQVLVVDGAKELGITVADSEVDEYVNAMKSNYDSDDAWKSALEQAGFTEESYRKVIMGSLYEQKVGEYFQNNAQMTDEDYVKSAQTYATYYNGAKRSSHILFKVDDPTDTAAMDAARAQANEILPRLRDGSLDFAEAAAQYSGDTGSAQKGGDVGWDVTSSFVTEYTDALANLEAGQISDPVQSDYGIHIIKVTEVFNAPEQITSMDQIPADLQESIKQMAASMKSNTDYSDWLNGLKEKATIDIKEMPKNLPYDVDMSKYQSEVPSEDAATTEASTASSDAATTEASAASSDASASSEGSQNAPGTAGASGNANE